MSLDARVTIRFTKYEKAELEKKAQEYQLKLAEYIRLKLLTTRDTPIAPIVKIDWDGYKPLGKTNLLLSAVGNNLNQLAHNANLSIQMGSPMQLQLESLNEFKDLVDQAMNEISQIRADIEKLRMPSYDR